MNAKHTVELIYSGKRTWDFRIVSANGNLICFSNQGYENRDDCERAVRNMIESFEKGTFEIENVSEKVSEAGKGGA